MSIIVRRFLYYKNDNESQWCLTVEVDDLTHWLAVYKHGSDTYNKKKEERHLHNGQSNHSVVKIIINAFRKRLSFGWSTL